MVSPQQVTRIDSHEAVVEAFQRFLVMPQAPSVDSALTDLGIDSIALVAILLELAEQLGLALETARVELADIRTIENVVLLIDRLRSDALPTG
jgi:acyl carrier protein